MRQAARSAAAVSAGRRGALRWLILAAMLSAQGSAATAAVDECSDILRLAAAAEETPAFTSIAGTGLHGLLGSYCRVDDPAPRRFPCTRSLAPPDVSQVLVVERFRKCLPGVEITPDPESYRRIRLRHGRLEVDIAEYGNDRAHVARIVTLYFGAARPIE